MAKPAIIVSKFIPVSAINAIEILGLSRIVTARQWAEKTSFKLPKNVEIPFTKATLIECAIANGIADWRLVFCAGKYYLINWAGEFIGLDEQGKSRAISNLDPKFSVCPKKVLQKAHEAFKKVRGESLPWNFYFPVSYRSRVNELSACHDMGCNPTDLDAEARKEVVAILRKPDIEDEAK